MVLDTASLRVQPCLLPLTQQALCLPLFRLSESLWFIVRFQSAHLCQQLQLPFFVLGCFLRLLDAHANRVHGPAEEQP